MNYFRNSSPFISGDFFSDLSDVSLFGTKFRNPRPSIKKIRSARIVFCPGDYLEELTAKYENSLNAKVLILGNSDRDYISSDLALPKSIKTVYLQNSSINEPGFQTIPIGIENLRLWTNGRKRLFKINFAQSPKNGKILVGPMGFTHPERDFFKTLNSVPGKFDIIRGRIGPREYARISSQYSFIACPRGNGLDTHRFWEALYRGSTPIVVKSPWSDSMRNLGIPLIEISEFSQDSLSLLDTSKFATRIDPYKIPALWADYWIQEFERTLKSF